MHKNTVVSLRLSGLVLHSQNVKNDLDKINKMFSDLGADKFGKSTDCKGYILRS